MTDLDHLARAEEALTSSVVAVPTAWDVLTVSGPDATSYLQGQVSQNVERLAVGATAWSFLLQPQGKVDVWGRLHRVDDTTVLYVLDRGFGGMARDRLERFKLRVEVGIELAEMPGLALRGDLGDQSGLLGETGPSVVAVDSSWGGRPGLDLLSGNGVGAGREQSPAADWVEGPTDLLTVLRCLDGRPAMGAELDEGTIPAAARVVNRSADFTKGCYVGQELVARVDSRGQNTPTRLCRLSFDGEPAPPGTGLLSVGGEDEKEAGVVTTSVMSPTWGALGLGYVARRVESPGALSAVGVPVSAVEVEDV